MRTQPHLALSKVAALGGFGDVVDRSAHAACAKKKARCAANGLDTVVDPAVHCSGGAAVLRVDAVVELRHGVRGKSPVAGRHGAGRVVGGHTRDGAQDFLRVLRAACVDGGAVDDRDRSGGFAGGQP
ncbi:hypothetical protein D3C71_1470910 [compost metagenome]